MFLRTFTFLIVTQLIQSAFAQGRPEWIYQPSTHCGARELCAVGEGLGVLQAQLRAREELARSFEVNVISSTQVETQSLSSQSAEQVVRGEVLEQVRSATMQTAELILNFVTIKETYQDRDGVFALAALDRELAGEKLREEIKALDIENVERWRGGLRSDLQVIMRNLLIREQLHHKYHFIQRSRIPSPIELDQVFRKRREFLNAGTTIYVRPLFKSPELEAQLTLHVITILLAHDYKVVKDSSLPHDYVLEIRYEIRPMHLNVAGFVRHEHEISLTSFKQHKKVGQLLASNVQVARNSGQGLERAMPALITEFKQRIDVLKLD
jgi:hypothetical protein